MRINNVNKAGKIMGQQNDISISIFISIQLHLHPVKASVFDVLRSEKLNRLPQVVTYVKNWAPWGVKPFF